MTVSLLFLVLAAICFFLKAIQVAVWKFDLMNLGFFFVILSMIF